MPCAPPGVRLCDNCARNVDQAENGAAVVFVRNRFCTRPLRSARAECGDSDSAFGGPQRNTEADFSRADHHSGASGPADGSLPLDRRCPGAGTI